jgi:hypothetical protein
VDTRAYAGNIADSRYARSREHFFPGSAVDTRSYARNIADSRYARSQWLDWWDGSLVASKSDKGTIVDGYPAPLDTLPLFVRAGTILPLWPENNFFDEKPHDPISLELWPQGESDFTLYEDDGVTRKVSARRTLLPSLLHTCRASSCRRCLRFPNHSPPRRRSRPPRLRSRARPSR